MECVTTGSKWKFPCNQWLCLDTGDGRTERELHPSLLSSAPPSPWEVQVFTSDLRGAGTDANVTLQLHGSQGSSQPVPLGDNIANFEQGECDVFQIEPGAVEVVGPSLEAITVSTDGSGPYPEWHLDKVLLTNGAIGEQFTCQYGG